VGESGRYAALQSDDEEDLDPPVNPNANSNAGVGTGGGDADVEMESRDEMEEDDARGWTEQLSTRRGRVRRRSEDGAC